jgi:hypothetical protein
MNVASLSITFRWEMEEIEPDGEPCSACGDAVYLKAFSLVLYLNERRSGRYFTPLCQSCGDIVKCAYPINS